MIPERLRWLARAETPTGQLAQLFADGGHSLFLVGGSLRDAIMGRPHEDMDFTTDARPERIKELIGQWADAVFTMGEAYGTIGAVKDGQTFEITTFRNEVYRDDSRKPRVSYSDDIEVDLSRRDFTVNSMALSLPELKLIDPHGGLGDLASRRLATPLSPESAFSDDPLRMLRLFRFVATLGFEPDAAAVAAVGEMAERLEIVSPERIRDEFSKLIQGEWVGAGLWGVVDSGLSDGFLPELSALKMEQDPIQKHKDVWAHTIAVVEGCDRSNLRLRLAALLHDIGKPATRDFGAGGVSFHHHEVVGARMTRDRLRELRYSKEMVHDVSQLVYLHLRPHTFKMGWTDSAVRRYVRDAGGLLEDLNALVRADVTTANRKRRNQIQNLIDLLEERIAALREREELEKLRAPVDGHQVMKHLGLTPGPLVGEIMNILLEHRIEEGPFSEDEAFLIAEAWAREKGIL